MEEKSDCPLARWHLLAWLSCMSQPHKGHAVLAMVVLAAVMTVGAVNTWRPSKSAWQCQEVSVGKPDEGTAPSECQCWEMHGHALCGDSVEKVPQSRKWCSHRTVAQVVSLQERAVAAENAAEESKRRAKEARVKVEEAAVPLTTEAACGLALADTAVT